MPYLPKTPILQDGITDILLTTVESRGNSKFHILYTQLRAMQYKYMSQYVIPKNVQPFLAVILILTIICTLILCFQN